jgi:hypothetical protein
VQVIAVMRLFFVGNEQMPALQKYAVSVDASVSLQRMG